MTPTSHPELTQLRRRTETPSSPAEAVLETFANPHPDLDYVVRLTAPELTSLCPVTGQPDFAVILVDYVPAERLVESKSFKLFIGSFRNHGAFHEDCTVYIHKRLKEAMAPKYLRVTGRWSVRGGIAIDVLVEDGCLPANCTLLPVPKSASRADFE